MKTVKWHIYTIAVLGIYFTFMVFFALIYPTQADDYSKKLIHGMTIDRAKAAIPYDTYGQRGLRSDGRFVGDRIDWKFPDGSLLHAYFVNTVGLASTEISKSDLWINKINDKVLGFVLLLGIIIFLKHTFR